MLSIQGQHEADTISQGELREVSELQATEWMAASTAHKAVLKLMARLESGAKIEPGDLTFDRELRMVRRKKSGTA